MGIPIVNGAARYSKHIAKMLEKTLPKLHRAVQWGDNLPKGKQIFYGSVATVLTENALGTVGSSLASDTSQRNFLQKVLEGTVKIVTLDFNVVEPIHERLDNIFEKGGWDTGGDIDMVRVWCGG